MEVCTNFPEFLYVKIIMVASLPSGRIHYPHPHGNLPTCKAGRNVREIKFGTIEIAFVTAETIVVGQSTKSPWARTLFRKLCKNVARAKNLTQPFFDRVLWRFLFVESAATWRLISLFSSTLNDTQITGAFFCKPFFFFLFLLLLFFFFDNFDVAWCQIITLIDAS